MKKTLTAGAFALLCVAGVASADPLALPPSAPVYFQFNNIEQVNASNSLVVPGYAAATGTQGNWGLLSITSVQNGFALPIPPNNDIAGGGGAIFSDDGPGGTAGQITGIFYGVNFTSPTTATGGFLDLYWQDAGADQVDAACLAGVTCSPDAAAVAKFTSGTFLARLSFASGITDGDSTTTIKSNIDPTTAGGSGHADSFANVDTSAAGAWTTILNADWFNVDTDGDGIRGEAGETRDIRFSTFFNADLTTWSVPADGTVGLRSNDPGRVFTAVPEPASLTLLGFGLAGLAARRRQAKSRA